MRNFYIDTAIGVIPSKNASMKKAKKFITRGNTTALMFDLKGRAFTFNQIEQLTFIIKQVDGSIIYYKMFEKYDGGVSSQDSRFSHQKGPNYDYVELLLSAEDTLDLQLTDKNRLAELEVALIIDGDDSSITRREHVITEPQGYVAILDSLYSSIIGE